MAKVCRSFLKRGLERFPAGRERDKLEKRRRGGCRGRRLILGLGSDDGAPRENTSPCEESEAYVPLDELGYKYVLLFFFIRPSHSWHYLDFASKVKESNSLNRQNHSSWSHDHTMRP